ncbi:MAG: SpoIID/LytB domain-containing protein, partial [Candidatus Omnitrophica bacterium]|nr:SpoIID/LytB domain-containing protein [Candidatus Omnitrophota bacterium]
MKKKIVTGLIVFIVAAAAVLLKLFMSGPVPRTERAVEVRVLLRRGEESIEISSASPCDVIDPAEGGTLLQNADISRGINISADDSRIRFGEKGFFPGGIRLSFGSGDDFEINGTAYRGDLIVRAGDRGLDAVNVLKIEDYLKGVVPCEVNSYWPYEVLKAQAIVSRSFALSKTLRRKSRKYDLSADTYSQVYRGREAENWRTSRAVDDTAGLVLGYNGRVVPGYFSSCCGGHTENASVVWGEKSLPPLEGVRCRWCWIS